MTDQEQINAAYRQGMADACAAILDTIREKEIKDVADIIPALAAAEKANGNFTVH